MNEKTFKEKVLQAFVEYKKSEGCDCCQDIDKHQEAEEKLAKLLDVEKSKDGYNWNRFEGK